MLKKDSIKALPSYCKADFSGFDSFQKTFIKEQQVLCSHPKVIINPGVFDFIFQGAGYSLPSRDDPQSFSHTTWHGKYDKDLLSMILSPKRNGITSNSDLSLYNAVDPRTSEVIPIYQLVPCGHCPNCVMSKRFSFVERCRLESQFYDTRPWFVTLTYRNDELPTKLKCVSEDNDGNRSYSSVPSLSVRDVQLFLKRLRMNLKRLYNGKYDAPIRYSCAGEYGKKGRPHYHLIIWNLQSRTSTEFLDISDILSRSWDKGFITRRLIDPVNDKSFKYSTKYLLKPADHRIDKVNQKSPFLNASNRSGGIGKPCLKDFYDLMGKTLNTKLKYFDKFSGIAKDFKFNSWSINSFFPSFNRLVPSYVRNAIIEREFFRSKDVDFCPYDSFDTWYSEVFNRHIFIPDFSQVSNLKKLHYHDISECDYVINKFLVKHDLYDNFQLETFLNNARSADVNRDRFFLAFFKDVEPVDLSHRAYIAKKDIDRSLSLEVL